MIPQDLTDDVMDLQEFYQVKMIEENNKIYLLFTNFPLPKNIYNLEETELVIFTTNLYPNANFDMFWTDDNLKLKDDRIPRSAEVTEFHLGKNRRRFSYHPYNNKPWNPAQDNVASYLEYIKQRLRKGD